MYGKDTETTWYNGKYPQERSGDMSEILALRPTHSLTLDLEPLTSPQKKSLQNLYLF